MRILSSLILIFLSLSLSAKNYEIAGDTFNAKLIVASDDFVAHPIFNIDLITQKGVSLKMPKDFKEHFHVCEESHKSISDTEVAHRWVVIIEADEDFKLSPIKLQKGEAIISFEDVEFKGLSKNVPTPQLNEIFLDEKSKLGYYIIAALLSCGVVVFFVFRKKKAKAEKPLDISDLKHTQSAREFSEKLFVHLGYILAKKFNFSISGKSALEISAFLKENGYLDLAEFIAKSDAFMYAQKAQNIDEATRKMLYKELGRLAK